MTTPQKPEGIELRSDTFTLPTEAMREAMRTAEVGDDVMGEDPTVKRLEAAGAQRLGKEAAVFVTSGTQGNLTSILAHTRPGQEIICEANAHLYQYEQCGFARIGGLAVRPIPGVRGYPDPEEIEAAIQPHDQHKARTRLIALENTHNLAGGACLTVEQTAAVARVAQAHGLRLHIDGARIFNAAVALRVDVKELAQPADSVTFCFSKGLGAPIGSLVVGSAEFVHEARRARKLLGGALRQVGVIAAAALVALEQMVDRLAEDHANARRIAETLREMRGVHLDPLTIQTNIVYFEIEREDLDCFGFMARLAEHGIRAAARSPRRMRLVTHKDVSAEDTDRACAAIRAILQE
jgi:threonine aldolase